MGLNKDEEEDGNQHLKANALSRGAAAADHSMFAQQKVAIPTMGLAAKFDNSESSLSSFASGNGYVSFCVSDAEVIQARFVEDSRSGGAILRVLLDISN